MCVCILDECILLIIYVHIVCIYAYMYIYVCIVSNIYSIVISIPEVCSTATNDETVDSGYHGDIKKHISNELQYRSCKPYSI